MKQILLIGKFDSFFENIASILKLKYHVQMSVDNREMVKGLLKISRPDAVVLCLSGLNLDGSKIMTDLQCYHVDVPVICIGTRMDKGIFSEFFRNQQFFWVSRDSVNEELLHVVADMIRAAEKSGSKRDSGGRKTVMVIDDNPILLRSMNSLLSGHYDVMLANSGTKAMTMIGQHIPDVVFLDCEMPVCDGKMTYKMLKDLDEMRDVPIIFLTGINDASYIQDVLRLQPAGYLLKPASTDRIFETLRKVLESEKN